MPKDGLPDYERMLDAYHRAFSEELRAIIRSLPIAAGQSVLDMACGDGAYTGWLAECVGASGRVAAVDTNPVYLETAREATAAFKNVEFVHAAIEALPYEDATFDLCWCAQSLYSLPDPVVALGHLFRVTKPDGVIAVLESDSLHHVILPWPVDVELAVRTAELAALGSVSEKPGKFYVGRSLRRVFREAGLTEIMIKTVVYDREAPLGPDERLYFTEHLRTLGEKVAEYLDTPMRRKFGRMISPESEEFLFNDPDLTATCVDQVALGRKRS